MTHHAHGAASGQNSGLSLLPRPPSLRQQLSPQGVLSSFPCAQALANRVNKSRQYIGLIVNEERSCPSRLLLDICGVTGSAAPLQWLCAQMGGEFYVDPLNAERAQLKARLAALDARAA